MIHLRNVENLIWNFKMNLLLIKILIIRVYSWILGIRRSLWTCYMILFDFFYSNWNCWVFFLVSIYGGEMGNLYCVGSKILDRKSINPMIFRTQIPTNSHASPIEIHQTPSIPILYFLLLPTYSLPGLLLLHL